MANLPDALFCSRCGASMEAKRQPLKAASEAEPKRDTRRFVPSQKEIKLLSIALAAVIVVAIAWALAASGSKSEGDLNDQDSSLATPSMEFGSPVADSYLSQKGVRTLQVDLPVDSVSEPIQWNNVSVLVNLEGWNGTDSQWSINTSKGDYFSRLGAEPESVGYQMVRKVGNASQWDYMALEFISYGGRGIDVGDHLRLTSNDFRLDSNGTFIPPGYWTIKVVDKDTGDTLGSTSFNVQRFE